MQHIFADSHLQGDARIAQEADKTAARTPLAAIFCLQRTPRFADGYGPATGVGVSPTLGGAVAGLADRSAARATGHP